MYLTHDEYTAMGGSIEAALFSRLEAKAEKRVDTLTHGRLRGEDPVRESVKNCMYELVSAMQADEAEAGLSGREIASMSNDGISVTYASGSGQESAGARYRSIVRGWLLDETTACGVPLMYAGVDA